MNVTTSKTGDYIERVMPDKRKNKKQSKYRSLDINTGYNNSYPGYQGYQDY